ncbi:FxDxF family PEP-CTERM protein [Pseudoduganella chitinolytica]|uniref:FxDxF family PEP-CTERM protein n=1 Tax=Pseudoduganella chitinolytica TaxID=34070 RepID=A0ABY8BAK4_9BURK|nr:FxDxF family PEP-CTERM protein [Pseudoduganella chitinolytica]WEF32468.1 FxDxF family PEP-CTERM protein [Pseudoduganella chitinolytica]
MKLQSIVLAALLSTAFGGAMAENYTSPVIALVGDDAGSWTKGFETNHVVGDFTDTWTFKYGGIPAEATGFVKNVQTRVNNIDFYSATLNGVALDITNGAVKSEVEFFGLPVNGTLTLVLTGKAFGTNASYSGTMDVTSAVPEPTTYGMLIGGLGVMAFLARRRKQA